MPLFHISLRAGKPEAYRQAIFDSPLAQLKFRAASAVANTYAEQEARRRAEQEN
jgi:hypothetical protein